MEQDLAQLEKCDNSSPNCYHDNRGNHGNLQYHSYHGYQNNVLLYCAVGTNIII